MDELIRKKGAPFDSKRLTDGQFYLLLKGEIWCPQPNFLSPAFYNGKKHVGLKWLQIAWNVEKCNKIFFRQIDPNLVKIWQNLINFHFQNILSHIFFLIVLIIFTYFHSIWSKTSIKNFNFCSNFQMRAKCLKIKIFKFWATSLNCIMVLDLMFQFEQHRTKIHGGVAFWKLTIFSEINSPKIENLTFSEFLFKHTIPTTPTPCVKIWAWLDKR